MSPNNNALITHRELLVHLARLLEKNQVTEGIDRIPLIMRPKKKQNIRCCVHKDRAVLKYKLMAMLGFDVNDETDELTSLAQYAEWHNLARNASDKMMTVVDEACSACVKNNYMVTNMCRGCDARTCMVNCPKKCISFDNGSAVINHDECVNCGLCMKNCAFHAIVYVPVPCEESCPVSAIQKNEEGIEFINFNKCIYCGKCITTCPFGAIVEKTNLPEIFQSLKSEVQTTALIAPAIAGQFKATFGQIVDGLLQLGFDKVVEVAEGAELTIEHEYNELKSRIEQGEPFVTNSCCPAYTKLINLHLPNLKPYQSSSLTPLQYTAKLEKETHPNTTTVFIGPCISKRFEAHHDPNVDFMLSFEELGTTLIAKKIEIAHCKEANLSTAVSESARLFPVSGGVSQALKKRTENTIDLQEEVINGIDRESIKALKKFVKNPQDHLFLEVMCCTDGCVGGCNTIARPAIAKRQINILFPSNR